MIAVSTLTVFRAPVAMLNFQFNPDESQAIAQATTLAHFPIPWKDYDGNNAGPLDSIAIAWPALLGQDPTYASARFTGIVLVAFWLCALYLTIRTLYGQAPACLGIIAPLLFFATALDFVQYTTELLPATFLAIATAFTALLWTTQRHVTSTSFAIGLLCGAAPFGKIQATPLALALLFLASTIALRRVGMRPTVVALWTGVLLVPVVFAVIVWWNGALGDALVSYVLQPLAYAGGDRTGLDSRAFSAGDSLAFSAFVAGELVLCGLVTLLFLRQGLRERVARLIPAGVALVFLALATIVIAVPGVHSKHYLLFAVTPLSLLAAFLLGCALPETNASEPHARRPYRILAALVVLCAAPLLVFRMLAPDASALAVAHRPKDANVERMLQRFVRPGDRLAIWGWMPKYFVVTGALLGTRDSISEFQILGVRYRGYYRRRYIADLELIQPRFFVDAVAPASFVITDRAKYGFETFPALDAVIGQHYRKVAETEGVRLYERIPSS